MNDFSKFHFRDVKEGEEIILVVHRNWFFLLQQFLPLIFLSIFLLAVLILVPQFFPDFMLTQSREFIAFLENFFFLVIWIYGFMIWIDFYFDVWIITNQRIVDIEQQGLFSRKASEMEYSKMQDVTTKVSGFIPTIFNYGDVLVQTAGEKEEFIFKDVSDPYKIKNIIFSMRSKNDVNETEKLGEMIKEKIQE